MSKADEPFDFDADYFDSRDVIERIDYLEADEDELDEDEREELNDLRALAEEADGYVADWKYGETFIRDDAFEDYARQLADDIGAIDANASWPLNRIDWEAAADDLRIDYTEFTLRGTTYLAR